MNNFLETILKYKKHCVDLIVLSIPLIIGNLGQILIGATDVFVGAKYNINTLAAISIANSIVFSIFIIGIGFLASISIVLANYRGSRLRTKKYFEASLSFSMILAAIFCALTLSTIPFIDNVGFEPILVPLIKEYIFITSFSFFGIYLFQAIKEFLQAHEIVNFPNFVLVMAVLVNLVLDFALVFGLGPFPSMGTKGLAIATLLTRTFMGISLLIYCVKLVKFREILHYEYLKQLLKIGYPIGIALMLEFLAFNIITFSIGRTAGILAATHNIITTISSATFMIPLAISNAIAIKVGFFNGAKDYNEVKAYSITGLAMSSLFMVMCSMLLLLFPSEIIKLFTDNKQILYIGIPIMYIAAAFQVVDGFQVSASGILKGLKKTKIVSLSILAGYWLLGLPLGFTLAYKYNYLLKGFWIGLAVSLFIVGIFQAIIIWNELKRVKLEYANK